MYLSVPNLDFSLYLARAGWIKQRQAISIKCCAHQGDSLFFLLCILSLLPPTSPYCLGSSSSSNASSLGVAQETSRQQETERVEHDITDVDSDIATAERKVDRQGRVERLADRVLTELTLFADRVGVAEVTADRFGKGTGVVAARLARRCSCIISMWT